MSEARPGSVVRVSRSRRPGPQPPSPGRHPRLQCAAPHIRADPNPEPHPVLRLQRRLHRRLLLHLPSVKAPEEEDAAITRNFSRGDFYVGSSTPVRIDPRLPVRLTLGDHGHFTVGEALV
ncbi:hypothetical protein IW261DRAFT_1610508 [Armillaria novae-zelandiae]|uniref:Uncharacterized protein n=1 Tax=Armillaria novae-zelandiae TaxID=153914 RepID=A0AA39P032_9AGAR|nr:hypothetical protein IW261DRAFT_1610508 [Armillaria novae-zelandiae]